MDVTGFLAARLDEDYWLAHKFAFTGQAEWDADLLARLWWYGDGAAPQSRSASDPIIQHAARHDPARALREVEAKRAILALHRIEVRNAGVYPFDPYTGERNPEEWDVTCETCGWVSQDRTSACQTLSALAAVYSDHPDYDPAWKP